jgi:hypothetical protein
MFWELLLYMILSRDGRFVTLLQSPADYRVTMNRH